MATPQPAAHPGSQDCNTLAHASSLASEPCSQSRPVSLKVHYMFDKEARVNCLARHPHTLHVQTIAIDDTRTIGVVDLRACIDAVIACSPELASPDGDYNVYAVDYSEPDTPLVGQGMLSWFLATMRTNNEPSLPKLVTGRVTNNLLAVFSGGNKETLEVKLKLSESATISPNICRGSANFHSAQPIERLLPEPQFAERYMESAMTIAGMSEWTSFMQANPQIGHGDHVSRVATPCHFQDSTQMSGNLQPFSQHAPQHSTPHTTHEIHRAAPTPVAEPVEQPRGSAPPSRPSSRASSRAPRKRQPTGRPRGRPRKKPVDGSTSGCEEATECEDGPLKKRAKTIKAHKAASNPFAAEPESLRVAASTSGSLRNFRPVAASNEAMSGRHLQEIPRAPTPIPEGRPIANLAGQRSGQSNLRHDSAFGQTQQGVAVDSDSRLQPLSPGQEDGRSPDSHAPTPAYSEDSMASSPPVHRTTPFMRSSPPPSSPVLPPMPSTEPPHAGSSFPNDEMDMEDLFGEGSAHPGPAEAAPPRTRPGKPAESKPMENGVPIQVFQMQDGPMGQDMVHICSYNGAPHPGAPGPPGPLPPTYTEAPSLPLKKDPPRRQRAPAAKKPRAAPAHPPAMEPTPPATTDAVEDRVSPAPQTEQLPEGGQSSCTQAPEPMQDVQATGGSSDFPPQACPDTSETTLAQQPVSSTKLPKRKIPQSLKAKEARPLLRSQSAGAVALALPSAPASEPVGPTSLRHGVDAEPSAPAAYALPALKRAASSGPLALPIPASDPVEPSVSLQQKSHQEQSKAPTPPMDAPPPASSPPARSNKNRVKKHAIKQRLEEAIMNGEMPPFCSNCGAIETPTWRKIWIQEHEGTPEYCEYSEKPGKVTAIEIIKRDAEDKPTSYRFVKKSLGPADDKDAWQELLLCNPCGIWLTKCKCHRPPDRWDKDFSRIGQERRRKGASGSNTRSRKPRPKGDAPGNPASDVYLLTDALGPVEPSSPKAAEGKSSHVDMTAPLRTQPEARDACVASAGSSGNGQDDESRSNPGSTHSRGSGTAQSSEELEFDDAVGSTRRLLFPSPRRDGASKVLGEVNVNMVQTSDNSQQLKRVAMDKENLVLEEGDKATSERRLMEDLFQDSVAAPPSTPPSCSGGLAHSSPFKTPIRATPSHRPITRSISRSLRSNNLVASPSQVLLQQTPTKTPRLGLGLFGSAGRRRSPRNHQGGFEMFDTPISRSISQAFSDNNNNFGLVDDLDLSSLPGLDATSGSTIEFGNIFSTDALMPSSPAPQDSMVFDYRGSAEVWAQWTMDHSGGMCLDDDKRGE